MDAQENLSRLLGALNQKQILCVGDIILDNFVYGDVSRISPESSSPVLSIKRELATLGGAANVAMNIKRLGGVPLLIGVVGRDKAADLTIRLLQDANISDQFIILSPDRPTTQKTRYVSEFYKNHILRADHEVTDPIDDDTKRKCVECVLKALPGVSVIILSDYQKGLLTPDLVQTVIEHGKLRGIPIIVDPKSASPGTYAGATIITPNKVELKKYTGINISNDKSVLAASQVLLDATGASAIITTRSEQGMTLHESGRSPVHIPAATGNVVDVSGAGDTVVATLGCLISAGAELEFAARASNIAAGIVISKPGTASLSSKELVDGILPRALKTHSQKIISNFSDLQEKVNTWKHQNLRVGFTNGCFDLIHPGHIHVIIEAQAECDRLIVALNSDQSVKKLKGVSRPIQNESSRCAVVAGIEGVDVVLLFDEDTPLEIIKVVRPSVLVKGADYTEATVVGSDFVRSYGGKVKLVDIVSNQSTSNIIRKTAKS